MTVQELAHWRYRIGAIERELAHLRRIRERCLERATQARHTKMKGTHSPYEIRAIADTRSHWDDQADEIGEYIKVSEYLLEEARYKVELLSLPTIPDMSVHGRAEDL